MGNNFSRPREFYSPRYATIYNTAFAEPDFRFTIHWEPFIRVDESGKATVVFYNADRRTRIKGIVEGLSIDGLPGMSDFSYDVK